MKKIAQIISFLLLIHFNTNAQWKNIATNLARIGFYSLNEDQILVNIGENNCFRLDKNSNNWEPIITNFIKKDIGVRSIVQNQNFVFILESFGNNIYISKDAGKNFVNFETIINANKVNLVLFNPQTNRIYVGAMEGVRMQYSDDNGKTWTPDTLGIDFLQFHSPRKIYNLDTMEIQESNTGIYYRNASKDEIWRRIDSKIKSGIAKYELIKHQDAILVSTSSGIFQFNGLDSVWLT
jgi:hypothetical protein